MRNINETVLLLFASVVSMVLLIWFIINETSIIANLINKKQNKFKIKKISYYFVAKYDSTYIIGTTLFSILKKMRKIKEGENGLVLKIIRHPKNELLLFLENFEFEYIEIFSAKELYSFRRLIENIKIYEEGYNEINELINKMLCYINLDKQSKKQLKIIEKVLKKRTNNVNKTGGNILSCCIVIIPILFGLIETFPVFKEYCEMLFIISFTIIFACIVMMVCDIDKITKKNNKTANAILEEIEKKELKVFKIGVAEVIGTILAMVLLSFEYILKLIMFAIPMFIILFLMGYFSLLS